MKTVKRMLAGLLALAVMITTLQTPMSTQAAVSAKKVKNAYVSYLEKQIANCKYSDDLTYWLYDFNKDGAKELVVSNYDGGARGSMDVYTYKDKKVVTLVKNVSEIGYLKGKKQIVAHSSGGALDFDYTVYKINKGKAVKVNKYACVRGVYKKDGKKFTQTKFNTFVEKVVTDLGTAQSIPKKYTSLEKIGFSVFNEGKTYTCITKATNNKVYYYTYQLGEEGMTVNKSKTKSAKITSKTKFYYGDLNLLFSGTLEGTSMDNKKWVQQLGKKQFIKKMETYWGGNDRIVVKNGKVEKVVIHIQVAG